MLVSSFLIFPRIGEIGERDLWLKGILSWDDLQAQTHLISSSRVQRTIIYDYLERAKRALYGRDGSFFAQRLPQKEYWRIYKEFSDSTLFLDIETTGLSQYYDKITLIGTFDGRRLKMFVKDNNLDEFPNYLRNYQVVVTFNGKLFDLPFIIKEFSMVQIPAIHIDLRYVLKSLGITGSLKKVEQQLGIQRPAELTEIGGREAAILWSKFLQRDDNALERLLLYNIYDTINM